MYRNYILVAVRANCILREGIMHAGYIFMAVGARLSANFLGVNLMDIAAVAFYALRDCNIELVSMALLAAYSNSCVDPVRIIRMTFLAVNIFSVER